MLDWGVVDHLFQGMGEVGDDDDGFGTGIFELMLQLARGIERVDVDHDHASAQDAEHGDGVLQQVRHHHRNPIPFLQLQLVLQVGSKGAGLLFKTAVGDGLAHVDEGGLIGKLGYRGLEHLDQGAVLVWINLGRDPFRITFQPDFFHKLLLHN